MFSMALFIVFSDTFLIDSIQFINLIQSQQWHKHQSTDFLSGQQLRQVLLIIPHEFRLFFVLAENEQGRYIGTLLVENVGESAVFHQVAFEVLVVD